jgi:hypothetical protein
MSEFVVFREPSGWFGAASARWWDDRVHMFEGERLDSRTEVQRTDTRQEADDLKIVMNMMMYKRPDKWATKEY